MAGLWIEAHQAIARHPKIKRAARRLGIPRAQMIGHLLCTWWWAVDYAPTGIVTPDHVDDLADEIDWEDDPDTYIKALVAVGLLDPCDGGWWIHDWDEHGWKATAQAREYAAENGRYGAHMRYHKNRGVTEDGCGWCRGEQPPEPPDIRPSRGPIGTLARGSMGSPIGITEQNKTKQTEQTGQNRQKPPPRAHASDPPPNSTTTAPTGGEATPQHPERTDAQRVLDRIAGQAPPAITAALTNGHTPQHLNLVDAALARGWPAHALADTIAARGWQQVSNPAAALRVRLQRIGDPPTTTPPPYRRDDVVPDDPGETPARTAALDQIRASLTHPTDGAHP